MTSWISDGCCGGGTAGVWGVCATSTAHAHAARTTPNDQRPTPKEFDRVVLCWQLDVGDWKFIGCLSI
jgi:hypothetical protein